MSDLSHGDYEADDSEARKAQEELQALQIVISALNKLPQQSRKRIISSVMTFLDLGSSSGAGPIPHTSETPISRERSYPAFSDLTSLSPKEFMLEKQPRSDVERIACLAYYLTHYRDLPHFKTLDLSKLNTEAAQPKFSNAAYASNNAVKRGFLVPSSMGNRQLSAVGEQVVRALPDRNAAKSLMTSLGNRRKGRWARKS